MSADRPDPDELLTRVKGEEARRRRGKLKVFLGAAAGVGKTYAMLEMARQQRAEGMDVVAGYVEPHGRRETEALLEGLEILRPRLVEHRGMTLRELDLDAALARRPALVLVDELAHTNAPGARHAKRWQDVLELLDAGINVHTTVNVQHVESLNDVVAKITGVVVRETVPDSVFEHADELELVDLPPDDLQQRLREGKVYVPGQAEEALQSFFRKGNLIALRELALRHTAQHVDADMRVYMREHAIAGTWPAGERLLVCVGPSPSARRLVRACRRMAERLGAPWIAAWVETPASQALTREARERVAQALRLAEQLGAETVTLQGARMSDEILAFARGRNVTRIVVGKPRRRLWERILRGSIVDALVEGSGEIDVHVISGDAETEPPHRPLPLPAREEWRPYGEAVLVTALASALAWAMFPLFELSNLIMLYLLAVVAVALRCGGGPAALASALSVGAFDFFFVTPYLTFAVSDTQYVLTFMVMLLVALVISSLTARLRAQADSARQRERQTADLYALARELAGTPELGRLVSIGARHVADAFYARVAVLLPGAGGGLVSQGSLAEGLTLDEGELAVARWVFDHGQAAGLATATLPGARALYLPLVASRGAVGVLGMRPEEPHVLDAPEQLHRAESFAAQLALAIERARLVEEAQAARVSVETERLRSSLLSSVSHDLRTPLSAITGAASTLLERGARVPERAARELLETVRDEAERLNRLVQNLLEMTRLESGALVPRKEWHPVEEVVGSALHRLSARLGGRTLTTRIPETLPLAPMDDVLVEQVLINLLDNALKYTPPGSAIEVSAGVADGLLIVEVADRGPGLAAEDLPHVFDKFYRGKVGGERGAGLGLAICRGVIEAHGGRIWAEPRPGGGLAFRFSLPIVGAPPATVHSDA